MTRTAAVSILLAACAFPGRQQQAPPLPADTARTPPSACLVADMSAPSRDTIHTIGVQLPDTAVRSALDCEHHQIVVSARPIVVTLTPPSIVDLRDVLDGSAAAEGVRRPDVVVTRDPDVQEYAERGVGYITAALPWTDTYALIALLPDSTAPVPTAGERDALARDAVRADVRGAAEPFRWAADAACTGAVFSTAGGPRPVVAYPIGDAIARELAARIVSLVGGSTRPAWIPAALTQRTPGALRIAPFAEDSIATALASGRAVAAVAPFTRERRAPCGMHVAPLVDARAHVIVRRGSGAAFIVGADGALWFTKRGAP